MSGHSDPLTLTALMRRGATRILLVKEIMEDITSIRTIVSVFKKTKIKESC